MSITIAQTGIADTAFARLETEGRLLNPVLDNITYAEGLPMMGPVRNPNENRPV